MDAQIAMLAAYFSNLAYRGFSETLRCEIARYLPSVTFFNSDHSQAVLAHDDATVAVMFRGVEPGDSLNLTYYLKTWLTFSEDPHGLVHKNFYDALNKVWDEIEAVLDRVVAKHGIDRVIFTGHSQGGAMAILAAARCKYVCDVYAFGAPRVGSKAYGRKVKSRVYRIVHGNDLVPRVPPPFPVFRHFGEKYHIIGHTVHRPKGPWAEFLLSLRSLWRRDFVKSLITDHRTSVYRRKSKLLETIPEDRT